MGNLLDSQNTHQITSNDKQKITAISKQWEVLDKTLERQILKSKKTSLIIERYSFQMENFQDFDSQNKLFQWRNQNPNSQFMVNVLSVGKDDSATNQSTFDCGSIEWCPSQKLKCKVYVITERILKLGEISDVLKFQKQIDEFTSNNQTKILYATEQHKIQTNDRNIQKIAPFIGVNFSEALARQLLQDWIRSIQVLCYKFGYFRISEGHLGMTTQKRGTAWISSNYALNHLNPEDRIPVTTAQQKFKFQKQTISKILKLSQRIPCFTNTVHAVQYKNIDRFDDFCCFLDQLNKVKRKSRKVSSHQPQTKNSQNMSLYVEQGSFMTPVNYVPERNSSFFIFDHRKVLDGVNLMQRMNSNEKIAPVETSFLKMPEKPINYNSILQVEVKAETKRSNTGDKVSSKLSPQSRHQQHLNFVNSNHKYCGKETAPTNELGHSSSLQSVNNGAHLKANFEEIEEKKYESRNMFKSQHNTKLELKHLNESNLLTKGTSLNKIYFHHNGKNQFSSEPHIFRSHAANDLSSPKSPKYHNFSFNAQVNPKLNGLEKNYSLDENNIVGPYRKDRVWSNLRKEKIALVDSMVMVREQSDEIDDEIQNASRGKYLMEESIIIMGREEDRVLSE